MYNIEKFKVSIVLVRVSLFVVFSLSVDTYTVCGHGTESAAMACRQDTGAAMGCVYSREVLAPTDLDLAFPGAQATLARRLVWWLSKPDGGAQRVPQRARCSDDFGGQ